MRVYLEIIVTLSFFNVSALEDESLAVLILARGGSKGIPMKNLALVGNKSLLCRSVTIAKDAHFKRVVVSTDYFLIAMEALKCGAQVFRRSFITSTDAAPSIWGVQEFLASSPVVDVVILLQATSPFIKPTDLQSALHLYDNERLDCVFALKRSHKLRWKSKDKTLTPLNFNPRRRPRRQDWSGELVETGAFYLAKRSLIEADMLQNERCGYVELKEPYSMEIDTTIDLLIANVLALYLFL